METCLTKYRERINKLMFQYQHLAQQVKEDQEAVLEAQTDLTDTESAQKILQQTAQIIQQQAHEKIAGVVTKCLQAVFDSSYEFQIIFEKKRRNTQARLVFIHNGIEIDPKTACGGGIIDVAAFALRLACLMQSKPALRKVLILDEPFKFVSQEYREGVRILLETLSNDMRIQFIIVTHIQELELGKVVRL